jgi:hypothetical protein
VRQAVRLAVNARLAPPGSQDLQRRHPRTGRRNCICAAVNESLGDDRYDVGEFLFARHYYSRSLRQNPWNVRMWAKVALARLGPFRGLDTSEPRH